MAGRSRGRNSNSRFHCVNPRTTNEHDDRASRPSTSRGSGGGYSDRHGFNKKVTFKANNRGGNNFRRSWDNGKTDLIRDQFDSEVSNRNGQGQPRNNSGRRNYNRGGHGNNFRGSSWTLKESSTGWYSIFVPNIDDGDEVLKIIQTYISPNVFFPYNKQYFDNALRFLVDDFKIAKLLHNTSYKITLRDDRKLVIKVSLYVPQRGTISFTPVSNEIREKMIAVMSTRYNPSTKSLDLSKFYACPLFTENQMFVPLNRPAVLLAALNMLAQHTEHDLYGLSLENNYIYLGEGLVWIRRLFPELKVLDLAGNKISDLKDLRSLSGYSIEVLNLTRNPVSDTEDKERYRRDVQQLFPMLNKLDNTDLPSRYSAIIGSKLKMPVNLGSSYPIPEGHSSEQSNPVMTLVESFLTQYYELYDNKVSKQLVAEAYHENATFAMSSCFLLEDSKGSLAQYLPESRNLLKISDRAKNGRNRYIHKGKTNIINFLEKLPKTKHDIGSFIIDVLLANPSMVQVVVNGVFAEDYAENKRPLFRSFSRTFCIVPVGSGWSIISDMLFITTVTDEILIESSKRFYVPKSKISSSKKNNSNNNNNNSTVFMEDTDDSPYMEASSSYQQMATPNYPPPSYNQSIQQSSFQSSPMSSSMNQPPPYQSSHASLGQPTFQQQNQLVSFQTQNQPIAITPAETVTFQTTQQSNASYPMFNNSTPSSNPASSTSIVDNSVKQQLSLTTVSDSNTNSDTKLNMVKSFSNESGMNTEWATKCLEENDWDYAKAALCFSKLKPNIPPAAFIH